MIAVTVLTIIVIALCLLSLGLYFYAGGLKADFEEAKADAEYWHGSVRAKHDRMHEALSQAAYLRKAITHLEKMRAQELREVYKRFGL
jgi:hypothetical protein